MPSKTIFEPKHVSRALAVISFIWGSVIITIHFLNAVLPSSQASNLQMVIINLFFMLIFGGVFVWIGILLWKHDESKYINWWATLPSAILFQPFTRLCGFIIRMLLIIFLPENEAKRLSTTGILFWGLLFTGIFYLLLKRLLLKVHNTQEVINQKAFKVGRYLYFGFLTYTFWAMVVGLYLFIFGIKPNSEDYNPALMIAGFVMALVIALGFFFLCKYLFITKPLESLKQSPQNLNNGSPGLNAVKPED